MAVALLIVIYLAFISLGLPDTLLGPAWPVMRPELGASLDMAGILSFTISLGTVISSLFSEKVIARFGTGKVAFFSIFATGSALLGFSLSRSFLLLLLLSVPLGLGAGAVDAGLNNFVALHYKPRHMSFLHCFWGIGAMSGPVLMSFWLGQGGNWRMGYGSVAVLLGVLILILGLSLPLWSRLERRENPGEEKEEGGIGNLTALKIPGVKITLGAFFCYCSLEITMGLWSASFLVERRGITGKDAAFFTSLFYFGVTAGRMINGLLAERLPNRWLIRCGQLLCLLGLLSMLLPLPIPFLYLGFLLFGLGCAPIYPSMLQETPTRFGRKASRTVMGLQMAVAYLGSTVMPPVLGFLAQRTSIGIFPYFLVLAVIVMFLFCERLNRFSCRKKERAQGTESS